jgi:uncharacterized repeat protein (TIGR01451 family)
MNRRVSSRLKLESLEDRSVPAVVSEFGLTGVGPAAPIGIVRGPDGAMWFTESKIDQIGRIAPDGKVTHYALPVAGSAPSGITIGPDNAVWFAETGTNRVGRLDIATGVVTEYNTGTLTSPFSIVQGPDGNLWVGSIDAAKIAKLTPSGQLTVYSGFGGSNAIVNDMVVGPDSKIYLAEGPGGGVTVAELQNGTPRFSRLSVGSLPNPISLAVGPDGNIWVGSGNASQIARVTPAGVATVFNGFGTANTSIEDVTAGPDGALWFTEGAANRIGRIRTDGTVTEIATGVTNGAVPGQIAVGSDNNLWFTEFGASQIGKIGLSADLSVTVSDNGLITALPGDTVTYTVTVTNSGPDNIDNANLKNPLPGQLESVTWTSVAAGGAVAPINGKGDIDLKLSMPANSSVTFTVTGKVRSDATGALVSTAKVTSGVTDPVAANNSASDVSVIPSPGIIVTGADSGGGPQVRVFNTDGSVRMDFFAYDPAFRGGVRVATGDVNGDGVQDIITAAGTGGGPHIRAFDGTSGAEVWGFFAYDPRFRGGVYIASADFNGDGKADIVTGAGAGGGAHVRIWDAETRQEMRGFFAYNTVYRGGVTVAAGDVNGDGRADLFAGTATESSRVRVYDGMTLNEFRNLLLFDSSYNGGLNLATGDVNGDGNADLIAGVGYGGTASPRRTSGPHVQVIDVANGRRLRDFLAYPAVFAGGVRVAAVDVSGDGLADIVTTPGGGRVADTQIFDAVTGKNIPGFLAYGSAFLGGAYISAK